MRIKFYFFILVLFLFGLGIALVYLVGKMQAMHLYIAEAIIAFILIYLGGILSQDCQADEYDWKRYGVIARAGFQQ